MKKKKIKSMETTLEYVEKASKVDGRDVDCPVVRVLAGAEPPMFTRWFHGWDVALAGKDAYQKQLDELKKQEGASVLDVRKALDEYKRADSMKFPYEELRRDYPKKPFPNAGKGIEKATLEKYLSDEDFVRIFKMDREKFYRLPDWKRQNLKAWAKLF